MVDLLIKGARVIDPAQNIDGPMDIAVKTSVTGPAYGLTVTMSKFLELGFSLEEMIAMTTLNPAKAVRVDDRKGSLKPGMDADISVLEIIPGKWPIPDSQGEILTLTRLIRPWMTVKVGLPIAPQCVPIKA